MFVSISSEILAQQFYGKENLPTEADYCGGSYGTNWQNTLEVCIENTTIDNGYVVFSLVLNKVAAWGSGGKTARKISAFTIVIDYNPAVLSTNIGDVTYTPGQDWQYDDDLEQYPEFVPQLNKTPDGLEYYFAIQASELAFVQFRDPGANSVLAEVRWKLQPGASGKTGIKVRGYQARGSGATGVIGSSTPCPLCVVGSGNGDIQVGEDSAPVITNVAVSGSPCSGATQTILATVDGDAYSSINWVVKKNGVPTTDGTVTAGSNKNEASVTWAAGASGDYTICGTPVSTASGVVEKCSDVVTVIAAPSITIETDKTDRCAGSQLVLTPTTGGAAVTNQLNASSYKWTKGSATTAEATSLTHNVTLAAGSNTWHFTAQTANGGCPVSADITLTGNAGPAVSGIQTALLTGGSLTNNKYYTGDEITFSVPRNTGWTYRWTIDGADAGTDNSCKIESAVKDQYTVAVTVTDANGCTTTIEQVYTKNTACDIQIALKDHFTGNTTLNICTGGVVLIDAEVSGGNCTGQTILSMTWYKKQAGGSYTEVYTETLNGAKKSSFAASEAGIYQVRVNTGRGIVSSGDVTVGTSGSLLESDKVVAWDPVSMPVGGGVVRLGANGQTVEKYYWKPEAFFAGTAYTEQFPQTTRINGNRTFWVYASHSNQCTSMDSSHVVEAANNLNVSIAVAGNPVCLNGKIRLTAQVTNGSGDYEYAWGTNDLSLSVNTNKEMIIVADPLLIPAEGIVLNQALWVRDRNTGVVGTAMEKINFSNLRDPKLKFNLTGNTACEGTELTVTKTEGPDIATYYWYVRDEATSNVKMTPTTSPKYKLDTRGNYTVWVATQSIVPAGMTHGCYSDTVNARLPVKVKGFDVDWAPKPVATYVSGQVLTAVAEGSNSFTGVNTYTFDWKSPAQGTMVSANNTVNPNILKVDGASEENYNFRVDVTNDGCTKTLEAQSVRNTNDNGLKLALANKEINFCYGGSAIMEATATGGMAPYTVTWYKVGQENAPLAGPKNMAVSGGKGFDRYVTTDASLLSNNDRVVVKVTDANTASPKVRRDTVTIRRKSDQAPQIDAGDPQLIALNTSTYLLGSVLLESNPIVSWNWSELAAIAADATTAYPKTVALNAETKYKVFVTDNQGCTSPLDSVTVRVTDGPYDLAVKVDAPALLCHESSVPLTATVTPADRELKNPPYRWTVSRGTLSNAAAVSPDWTMGESFNGSAEVLVVATDKAGVMAVDKAVVSVSDKAAPELLLAGYKTSAINSVCSGSTELKVTERNNKVLTGITWYAGDAVVATNTDKYIHTTTETAIVTVRVTASAADGGCPAKNVANVALTAYPQPAIAWEASSSPEQVPANSPVEVKAEITTTTSAPYTFTWAHVSTPPNTKVPGYTDNRGETGTTSASAVNFADGLGASSDSHPYDFQVYVTDKNGCPSETITRSVVVDDGSLFVTVTAPHGDYCRNGAAQLTAEVKNAPAEVSYQWYRKTGGTAAPIAGATGKDLWIADPNETDRFYVVVTSGDKTGTTENMPAALKQGTRTATDMNGYNLNIPKNTKTALAVNTKGATVTSWNWTPVDKLAAGENTLASPYTVLLSAPQDYTAYAVMNDECIDTVAVHVDVINVPVPPDPQENLMVKVWPTPDTVCVRNELRLYSTVWGTTGDITSYTWVGDDNLSTKNGSETVFNADNRMLAAGTYSYSLLVTTATGLRAVDRADIVVVNETTPTLAEEGAGDRCSGNDVKVKVTPATGAKYTWILDGVVDPAVTGNTYAWPEVVNTAGVHYNLKVIATTDGYCRTDTLTIDADVMPGVKLEGLEVADSCGQVIVYTKGGSNATYTWTLTAGGDYLEKSAGASEDTLYLRQKAAMPFSTASMEYTVQLEMAPKSGGCKATGSLTGHIYYRPRAVIAGWTPAGEITGLPYTMVEKGTSETIFIDAAASEYANSNSNVEWSALHAALTPASDKQTVTVKDVAADDSVFLTIANKEDASCRSLDTMPVYLYPEAPELRIDTVDASFVKAALHLGGGTGNYTVWSRKWDPYCLTDRFSGDQVYVKEPTAINITDTLWREPAMDTLEFYYATSGRTIAGRTWDSKTTSDTVGYYLFDLLLNATLTSDSYMAVYFDFAKMGCATTLDVARRIKATDSQSIIQLYKFDYISQKTVLNTYMSTMDKIMGTAFSTDIPILIIRPQVASQFMQYGKLSEAEFNILRTNTTVNNVNWVYVLPQKNNLLELTNLFTSDFGNVAQLVRWNFNNQRTSLTSKLTPMTPLMGDTSDLRPLQVIGINLRAGTMNMIWK